MIMNINEIKSAEWSLNLNEIGSVVEGNDDINQCIGIIIRTLKGSDPFRPLFGCDVFKYIDIPQRLAAPGLAKEIGDSVQLWEPRIEVRRVTYVIEGLRIYFSVDWVLIGGGNNKNNTIIDLLINEGEKDPGVITPGKPTAPTYVLTTETYDGLITENEEIFTI